MSGRLFTPRFLTMFAFSFTVFVSAFQLLPAAPYRILALGGSHAEAGLFLGFLTFACALSAPFTGSLGDRLGQRHVLMWASAVLLVCTASYAVLPDYRLLLCVVVLHGVFWSALLSASGAYMTATVPAARRAEGLSYWGLASVFAIAVAPALGFWIYRRGWVTLCLEIVILHLVMLVIAWRLPDDRATSRHEGGERHVLDPASGPSLNPTGAAAPDPTPMAQSWRDLVEWRVLGLSVPMALISFGYGGLTSFSALFADALHVSPRGLFLTAMAASILVSRLTVGRSIDRLGHRRVLLPALIGPSLGLALLAGAQGWLSFAFAGLAFGVGFGLMYPAYTAYVMNHVPAQRRGAAFGAMLAAFDTGIGSGSSIMGWIVHGTDFRRAFAIAAGLALLALPGFLFAERELGFKPAPDAAPRS
jgi:MFS family permease